MSGVPCNVGRWLMSCTQSVFVYMQLAMLGLNMHRAGVCMMSLDLHNRKNLREITDEKCSLDSTGSYYRIHPEILIR